MKQVILDHNQINQKINRLAHQIIEHIFEEQNIFIGGIVGNGLELAKKLSQIIQEHSDLAIQFYEVELDKDNPLNHPIELRLKSGNLDGACVILVDDVLNSGKTMQYALHKILEHPIRSVKTVALVDRQHRRYPIKADFVGIGLSTTLKEHVEVEFEENNFKAQLI